MLLWYPRLPGRQSEVPAPETRQLFAQIQPHSGGTAPGASVGAGVAPLVDAGKFVGRYADAVIPDAQQDLLSQGSGRYGDDRILPPVAGGVLEKLPQDEFGPFFIGVDRTV